MDLVKEFAPENFEDAEEWARSGGLAICSEPGLLGEEVIILSPSEGFLELAQDELNVTSPIRSYKGCYGSPINPEQMPEGAISILSRLVDSVLS